MTKVSPISERTPVHMLLWCPVCFERHIDREDMDPHKTHACQYCGLLWRPTLIATHGVWFLPGCLDEPEEDTAEDEEED